MGHDNALSKNIDVKSILAEYQKCGVHEFECGNKMCLSIDDLCDGVNDCGDNTDEINCGE